MNIKNLIRKITWKNLKRAWKIYFFSPKEKKIFFDYKSLPVCTHIASSVPTETEPKQVAVDVLTKQAYVSCMKGHCLQEFSFEGNKLSLVHMWRFTEQCVEVEVVGHLCYVTTTNFERGDKQSSHLHVINRETRKILSSIDTQGAWSKVIKIDEERAIAYVSNWHSSDLSIIDVQNPQKMEVLQVISCGEAPRGIVIRPDGAIITTSFYGGKIFVIQKVNGLYRITDSSKPFDEGHYAGNMRDIMLDTDNLCAWVSNLGRNMLHQYDPYTLSIRDSILVCREPNSMRFFNPNTIIVSARKDDCVCFVDIQQKKPVGVSVKTGKLPTGLATIPNGFLVTNFEDSTIELHVVSSHLVI